MEKSSCSQWNIQRGYYILNTQNPVHKWEIEIPAENFLKSAYHFFVDRIHVCHFLFIGKLSIPAGIYLLKVNNRNTRTRCEICSKLTNRFGLQIDFPYIFKWMLIILCPWSLLRSRLRIFVTTSLRLKVILEIDFSVFLLNVKGRLLSFVLWNIVW